MTKHIVAFDLETTGLDVQTDHILQIGLVKFDSSTFEIIDHRCWYIKPARDFTIAPDAAAKTGFTKEFILENGVLLTSVWQEAVDFIGDCDILTYNGNTFDVPMLYNNLIRANLTFDFKSRTFYGSLVIKSKFMEGGIANGHPEKILDKIWKSLMMLCMMSRHLSPYSNIRT